MCPVRANYRRYRPELCWYWGCKVADRGEIVDGDHTSKASFLQIHNHEQPQCAEEKSTLECPGGPKMRTRTRKCKCEPHQKRCVEHSMTEQKPCENRCECGGEWKNDSECTVPDNGGEEHQESFINCEVKPPDCEGRGKLKGLQFQTSKDKVGHTIHRKFKCTSMKHLTLL